MAKIDPKTCSHPLISRHIDRVSGGFSGTWVCARCKQEFISLVTAPTGGPQTAPPEVNYTLPWPYCFPGAEGIDDDH